LRGADGPAEDEGRDKIERTSLPDILGDAWPLFGSRRLCVVELDVCDRLCRPRREICLDVTVQDVEERWIDRCQTSMLKLVWLLLFHLFFTSLEPSKDDSSLHLPARSKLDSILLTPYTTPPCYHSYPCSTRRKHKQDSNSLTHRSELILKIQTTHRPQPPPHLDQAPSAFSLSVPHPLLALRSSWIREPIQSAIEGAV
jgi:hypothetical protein